MFTPAAIGRLRLDNRLIMAAMGNSLADGEGRVSDAMVAYYRTRAAGGAGLVVTQFASVNRDDMMPYSLAVHDDSFIPGLKRLVDTVHAEGSRICIQLMHPGLLLILLKSLPDGMTIKVPSLSPRLTGDRPYEVVAAADIDRFVGYFVAAAGRVRQAGADAVEIHACHGCLASTFLSPVTNRRDDDYGGSAGNRLRFVRRIVAETRRTLGDDFPISVRINGNDDISGGVTDDEVVQQAIALEKAGADAISISRGLEYWSALMAPPYIAPDGVNLTVAEAVKQAVTVPVIVAGKITPELAEQAVASGRVDFVALGRPLLADPELPNKLREGRREDVWQCLYCNSCLRSTWRSCTVNPFLYREAMLPLVTAETPKKIVIIGGGIAGMQSARLLTRRGHRVSLHERGERLGGQWNTAARAPGKQHYTSYTEHLERDLRELHVEVRTGSEVTRRQVLAEKPDAVIVATGAVPAEPEIAGADGDNVHQANDVLDGRVEAEGPVVVMGGRSLAIETALFLDGLGREVTIVCRSRLGGRRGADEKIAHRAMLQRLVERRIPVYADTAVLEIGPRNVTVRLGEEIVALPCRSVVLAVGATPVDELAGELEGAVAEVYTVGDCVQPGTAARAAYSAARLAIRL